MASLVIIQKPSNASNSRITARLHRFDAGLRHLHGAEEVDVEHLPPDIHAHALDHVGIARHRIVDAGIDAAEALDRERRQREAILVLRNIGAPVSRLPPGLLYQPGGGFQISLIARTEHDPGALLRGDHGHLMAQPWPVACDDDDLVPEQHGFLSSIGWRSHRLEQLAVFAAEVLAACPGD
jgi:hypothetical protein